MNDYEYPSWEEVEEKLHRLAKERTYRDRLSAAAENWEEADRIRRFLAYLTSQSAENPDLVLKAERLTQWAERYLRGLDPVRYSPDDFFQYMEEPVPPPTAFEVMRYI